MRLSLRPGAVLLSTAVVAGAASTLLDLRVPTSHRDAIGFDLGWTGGVPGVALAWAGAVVLAREPRHRLGWVLGVFGVWWALDGLAASWVSFATYQDPVAPGASPAYWVYQRLGAGLLLALPLVLLLYPHGRLPEGRWRTVAIASIVATSLLPVTLLAVPSSVAQDTTTGQEMPAPLRGLTLDPVQLPVPDGVWTVLLRTSFLLLAVSLLPVLAVVVQRYRSARGLDRARMRWLLWAAVVDALVMTTLQLLPDSLGSPGLVVAVCVTAAAAAVGVTRPDLGDVDRLLGGTLLSGALLASALVVDVLVLGVTGTLLGGRLDGDQSFVVAVLLVTAVYAPLRHRLWRWARRWVVGERDDPYTVMSALGERLEEAGSGEQLLEVARAVAAAFRAPYVGVEVQQANGELVRAEHGSPPARTREMPIAYRGERIGRLLMPVAGTPVRLRPEDERLLADVVRQAAAAVRAERLAEALQRSQAQLVTAVEDERRRLRRELHDGLGPSLAAVASRIDTARILAGRDPDAASRTLGQAREELTGMLAEVRRLVHGLRPPALDDVGLAGAVRQLATGLAGPDLSIEVEVTHELAKLPAAVEVAALRIASEALTNVARHADARRCRVLLRLERDFLDVQVEDDGVGIARDAAAGVGLLSLRERAGELGGRCEVVPRAGGGTVVKAVLPVPVTAAGPAGVAAGGGSGA